MLVFKRHLVTRCSRTGLFHSVALHPLGVLCKVTCQSSRQEGKWEITRLCLEVTNITSNDIALARTQACGHTYLEERLGGMV